MGGMQDHMEFGFVLIYFFDFFMFISSGAEAQSRDHICSLNPI